MGNLVAEDDQRRLENGKRKRGYEVSEKWLSTLFITPQARKKHGLIKRSSDFADTQEALLKAEWYDGYRDYIGPYTIKLQGFLNKKILTVGDTLIL